LLQAESVSSSGLPMIFNPSVSTGPLESACVK
jgi:hypothetical protein